MILCAAAAAAAAAATSHNSPQHHIDLLGSILAVRHQQLLKRSANGSDRNTQVALVLQQHVIYTGLDFGSASAAAAAPGEAAPTAADVAHQRGKSWARREASHALLARTVFVKLSCVQSSRTRLQSYHHALAVPVGLQCCQRQQQQQLRKPHAYGLVV
jgi:hypothetical protein